MTYRVHLIFLAVGNFLFNAFFHIGLVLFIHRYIVHPVLDAAFFSIVTFFGAFTPNAYISNCFSFSLNSFAFSNKLSLAMRNNINDVFKTAVYYLFLHFCAFLMVMFIPLIIFTKMLYFLF